MAFLRLALFPVALLAAPALAQDASPPEQVETAVSWDPEMWDLADSEFTPEAAWRL